MADETREYLAGAAVGLLLLFGLTGAALWRVHAPRPTRRAGVWWLVGLAVLTAVLITGLIAGLIAGLITGARAP